MRAAENWKDYELIDTSGGERLERWGTVTLIRPDPQVIWETAKKDPRWKNADAHYLHTGLFPEQAVNWDFTRRLIEKAGRPIRVLNLFGYTGAATLACMAAGAHVTHVDASRGMVNWARENAAASGLGDRPVRWLVDDCLKFVQREQRRGSRYDGIIMDPPSYGRGPGGEVWKLEEQLHGLLDAIVPILSADPLFFLLNSYSAGLSPSVMQYMLSVQMKKRFGGQVSADEIGLPVTSTGLILPCGSTAIWQRDSEEKR